MQIIQISRGSIKAPLMLHPCRAATLWALRRCKWHSSIRMGSLCKAVSSFITLDMSTAVH